MMKTSFTKLFKERWRALIPLLFFCTMSFMVKADPCGAIVDGSDISLTISCSGLIEFDVDDYYSTSEYALVVDGVTYPSLSHTHGTSIFTSEAEFLIIEVCHPGTSKETSSTFFGEFPIFEGGGDYTFEGTGKTASSPFVPTLVPNSQETLDRPTVSITKTINPSCPGEPDGVIELLVKADDAGKCNTGIFYSFSSSASPSTLYKLSESGIIQLTGLGAGTETISFSQGAAPEGCVCALGLPDPISVLLTNPRGETTSLACINEVNLSVDENCVGSISAADMLAGAYDHCAMVAAGLTDAIDSIFIIDPATGAITGSGTAMEIVSFDASPFIGKSLTIEVHDGNSGNYCWGTIFPEDKSAPVITCNKPSFQAVPCLDFGGSIKTTLDSMVVDCSPTEVTVISDKTITNCSAMEDHLLKMIEVTYYAEDYYGNRSTVCNDTVQFIRFDSIMRKSDTKILLPPDFVINPSAETDIDSVNKQNFGELASTWCQDERGNLVCNDADLVLDQDGNPAPIEINRGGTMYPRIQYRGADGKLKTQWLIPMNYETNASRYRNRVNSLLSYCKVGVTYEDIVFENIGCNETKITRQWRIYEWSNCDAEMVYGPFTQEIVIVDSEAPTFDEPVADWTGTVNTYECSKYTDIPLPVVSDNCSDYIETEVTIYDSTWTLIGPDVKTPTSFEFPLGKSYVVYEVFDECRHNNAKDTAVFTVVDKTAPVTICKEFLVVGISVNGTVRVPSTSFDNGSYDDCALETTCVVRMDDIDMFNALDEVDDSPDDGWVLLSTIKRELLACERDFEEYATERGDGKDKAFYLHLDDLCQKNIWFCCLDDKYSTDEQPTSSDEDVMVVFRAIDYYGNSNECMVFVDIQDKTRPSITCLPDVTVDCDVALPSIPDGDFDRYINISDSTSKNYFGYLFGNIVNEGEQESFGVDFSHVRSENEDQLVDAVFFDNCNDPDIYMKISKSFDACKTGEFTRSYFAKDASGNESNICTQVIRIESGIPFELAYLTMPDEEILIEGCGDPKALDPEMTGQPTAPAGACMLFGMSSEDQTYYFNTNAASPDIQACFKVVRTWSLIDWCNSEHNYKPITFTQVIKVVDNEAPEVTCEDTNVDVDIAESGSISANECDVARVDGITASVTDVCTAADQIVWDATVYSITLDRVVDNSPVLAISEDGGSATHSGNYAVGDYYIEFLANDRCGNVGSCRKEFSVTNSKAPTPYAFDVSTVLMTSGNVAIWASDLDKGSSVACGDEKVYVAIARADEGQTPDENFALAGANITFNCSDVNTDGSSDVLVNFYAYVIRNGEPVYSWTTVKVDIQNHSATSGCDSISTVSNAFITGNIRTEGAANVPDVEVGLLGGNQAASALDATVTDTKGQYAFPAMPMGGEYVIDPVSATDYLNGVTTLDLVLIQRYVLGLADLPSAYKIIAADINKDNNISAIDLVDLRSVILGIRDEFVNNESWRFVDATYEFADDTNPLAETFSESYTISELSSDMTVDFVGVKVGDVNGSADAASTLAQSRSKFNMTVADQNFNSGDIIQVPLKVSTAIELLGFQFTTSFSSNKLQFAGIDAAGVDFAPENLGTNQLAEGILTASWNDVKGTNLAGDEAIITLNFKAMASGTLSESFSINSDVTTAEIYNTNLETMNISLNFTKETTALASGFELGQNTPNPFADNTMISFTLPTAANATLTVFDVTGKVLKLTRGSFDKGLNTIEISKNELASSGVLYYTLETDGFTDTKRMVVLK